MTEYDKLMTAEFGRFLKLCWNPIAHAASMQLDSSMGDGRRDGRKVTGSE